MHLPALPAELALGALDDASLLSAMPVALALQARGRAPALATLAARTPLGEALGEWLEANRYPHAKLAIATPGTLDVLAAPASIVLEPPPFLRTLPPAGRVVLLAPGAEAAEGHDPDAVAARIAALAAEGAVLDVSWLAPLEDVGRAWLELVEHVHHRVGPAAQATLPDALRAALLGRHGLVPVNLGCRDRPPRVSWTTACFVWLAVHRL